MEHARNFHPVHPANMNTWAPFRPSCLSADQDDSFGDAVFASVMDGLNETPQQVSLVVSV